MKILHYSLGFPPYRKGGMTMYCLDLMSQQITQGMDVGLLWPGRYLVTKKEPKIHKHKEVRMSNDYLVKSFELQNPSLVPLIDGIRDPKKFMIEKSLQSFITFFENHKFDILHIHTLMGLPRECIQAAKIMKIKLIFTTHDFYGLCPNCSFMIGNSVCNDDNACRKCVKCNKSALSVNKIKLLQSPLYKSVKQYKVLQYLRQKHIDNINESYKKEYQLNLSHEEVESKAKEYYELRKYYITMLNEMDFIHFNSNNTKKIYENYISSYLNSGVISITHKSINNNKILKKTHSKIKLGYLGPLTIRKGFYDLISVLNKLFKDGYQKFELHIYSPYQEETPYLIQHPSYSHEQLSNIMNDIDILIAPSLCDTFGFTILEALSYGVPVIINDHVGAKDLIENNKSGIIYKNNKDLQSILRKVLENNLNIEKMNQYIVENVKIKNFREHSKEILEVYYKILEMRS